MSDIVEQVSMVVLVVAVLVVNPLVVLAAMNLLGFTIAVTMKTWFAALLLVVVFGR